MFGKKKKEIDIEDLVSKQVDLLMKAERINTTDISNAIMAYGDELRRLFKELSVKLDKLNDLDLKTTVVKNMVVESKEPVETELESSEDFLEAVDIWNECNDKYMLGESGDYDVSEGVYKCLFKMGYLTNIRKYNNEVTAKCLGNDITLKAE